MQSGLEEDASSLHETECSALRVRIEFLEETIRGYRSLPVDLLGSFDVSQCKGHCEVLRQNFWDVWNTNTSLNARFEHEMQRYKDEIQRRDERIMELESVNGLLETSLSQLNAQVFELRREAVGKSLGRQQEEEDLEGYFTRKLEEERSTSAVLRCRITELEESLYLKEQESGARQMQINHLLSLSNQLEHASEVNMMRNKLREAEKRIQELTMQRFAAVDSLVASIASSSSSRLTPAPARMVVIRINIEQDQRLASRFRDFFRRLEMDGPLDADHQEENLYDQFLLDQPNQEKHKLRPDMYLREELVCAMRAVCAKQSRTDGAKRQLCQRDFAACLVSIGGRFRRKQGVRYWVNVGMTRRPLFSWDI